MPGAYITDLSAPKLQPRIKGSNGLPASFGSCDNHCTGKANDSFPTFLVRGGSLYCVDSRDKSAPNLQASSTRYVEVTDIVVEVEALALQVIDLQKQVLPIGGVLSKLS